MEDYLNHKGRPSASEQLNSKPGNPPAQHHLPLHHPRQSSMSSTSSPVAISRRCAQRHMEYCARRHNTEPIPADSAKDPKPALVGVIGRHHQCSDECNLHQRSPEAVTAELKSVALTLHPPTKIKKAERVKKTEASYW